MADAGINDISKRSNINKVLDVMLSKFRLDLTDEQGKHNHYFFFDIYYDYIQLITFLLA
jgi:hypothetical protein